MLPIGSAESAELRQLALELITATEAARASNPEPTHDAGTPQPSTSLEIHGSALRDAANTVVETEVHLALLWERRAGLVADLRAASEEADASTVIEDDAHEARVRRRLATIAFACWAALALVLARVDIGALPPLLALVLGGLFVANIYERSHERIEERAVAHAAERERAEAHRAASPRVSPALVELDAEISDATARLDAVEDYWRNIAGPDADPHDIGTVLRLRDAQHTRDETAVPSESVPPASRPVAPSPSVQIMLDRALARWKVAWAALGVAEPPPPDELDAWLADVRYGPRSARRHGPLVLVEPTEWLEPDLLHDLQELAHSVDVYIVIERT